MGPAGQLRERLRARWCYPVRCQGSVPLAACRAEAGRAGTHRPPPAHGAAPDPGARCPAVQSPDNFDLLFPDDLGCLPQGAEESEVLFTLIAERHECRSLGITSNLVFSEWERTFANPMAPLRPSTGWSTPT